MKKNIGFTIIELVIVIALMGILSIPALRFVDVGTFNTGAKTDVILSVVEGAQKLAIAQRRNIYVILDGTNLKLCYVSGATCSNANTASLSTNALESINVSGLVVGLPANMGFGSNGKLLTDTKSYISINGVNKVTIEMGTGYVHR
jgi:MSHA pilin protein MshC